MPQTRLPRIVPAIIVPLALAMTAGCNSSSPSTPPSTGPNPPAQSSPGTSPVTPPGNTGGGGGTRTISFASDVGPIFKQNCAQCHSPSGSAYHRAQICDSAGNPDYNYIHANVSALLGAIQSGQMPPSGALSASDVQAIQAWANEGTPNN